MSTRRGDPRLLLIGPRCIEDDVVGGTKVSFENLVSDFERSGRFELEVIDTSRPYRAHCGGAIRRRKLELLALSRALGATASRPADLVLLNLSARGCLAAGPLLWQLSRLRRRPLAIRLFGGDLDLWYDRAPRWQRALARRSFLRADLLLLQTRGLCRRFELARGARWFPTTRDLPSPDRPAAGPCRRFVFLSQLRTEKGLLEALAASDRLPEGCGLSVYGPGMRDLDPSCFSGHPRARWRGALPPQRVSATLAEHDALVFPSWYEGEGMPGAVVEAMQLGLPVLGTRWRALPELVLDGQNGLIVEPRSAEELAGAMLRLAEDRDLYQRLSAGGLRTGEELRSPLWHARLEEWLGELAGAREAERCAA